MNDRNGVPMNCFFCWVKHFPPCSQGLSSGRQLMNFRLDFLAGAPGAFLFSIGFGRVRLHFLPKNPDWQLQVKSFMFASLLHRPPFLHGLLKQGILC